MGARKQIQLVAAVLGGLIAFTSPARAANPLECDTGFRPERDGFNFANQGDYNNRGNCKAMSSLAAWYFGQQPPLAERFAGDDTTAQTVVGHMQDHFVLGMGLESTAGVCMLALGRSGDFLPAERLYLCGLELIGHMLHDRRPQLLIFRGPAFAGHCVLVYGYKDGHFLVYDNVYPRETLYYDFDLRGMRNYRRASGAPLQSWETVFTAVGFLNIGDVPASWIASELALPAARSAQDLGFMTVAIDELTATKTGFEIKGTATGGLSPVEFPATRVELHVAGQTVGTAPLRAGHFAFRLTLPRGISGNSFAAFALSGEVLAQGDGDYGMHGFAGGVRFTWAPTTSSAGGGSGAGGGADGSSGSIADVSSADVSSATSAASTFERGLPLPGSNVRAHVVEIALDEALLLLGGEEDSSLPARRPGRHPVSGAPRAAGAPISIPAGAAPGANRPGEGPASVGIVRAMGELGRD